MPRLVITPGEPAGIGPDICLQLVQDQIPASIVFVADPLLIEHRARQLNLSISLQSYEIGDTIPRHRAGRFPLIPVATATEVTAGQLSTGNASYVLETLACALRIIQDQQADALVTGPVHKGIINDAGISFTGHTEWLAEHTNAMLPVMMLANDRLRVALATTHLPLSQVSRAITADRLVEVIRILHDDLASKFHITHPRIRVCGLNPHAGENGHLGIEEIEIIEPVINQFRKSGMDLTGPVPADTAFIPESLQDIDAVLAMYHDQGLPVLKYSGFDTAVNVTLGLPIIRTSVDHGTALHLAGTGNSSASSLRAAIEMAIEMVGTQDS